MTFVHYTESPVGRITIISTEEAILGIAFEEERHPRDRSGAIESAKAILLDAERQIQEYFGGWRQSFDLPLAPVGTEFQQLVWAELQRIPFGETIAYSELARRLGREKAVRAVGAANGRNPIGIVIPCHRVIGADGSLTGYGGGISRKEYLLRLEGAKFAGGEPGLFD